MQHFYYERLHDILPSGGARGTYAYHPAIAPAQTTNIDDNMENRESATGDASNAPSMTTPVSTESPIHPSINSSLRKHHLVDTSRDSSQLLR